jgi:cell division protein FtsL
VNNLLEARVLQRDSRDFQHQEIYSPRPQRPTETKKKKGRYVLTFGVIALSAMMSLSQFALLTEGQFRMERLNSELNNINAQNERLAVEVARLKSVARIEEIAKAKLNMIEPESHQIIYIDEY